MCCVCVVSSTPPAACSYDNLPAVFPARGMRAWEQLCGIIGGEGSLVHKYAGTCIVFQPLLLTLSFVLAALHGVCVENRLGNRRACERAVAKKIVLCAAVRCCETTHPPSSNGECQRPHPPSERSLGGPRQGTVAKF